MPYLPVLTQSSIWMKHDYSKVTDWIACWSVELDEIEKLTRRGFAHCGNIRLSDRAKALESEIKRLEDSKRTRLS